MLANTKSTGSEESSRKKVTLHLSSNNHKQLQNEAKEKDQTLSGYITAVMLDAERTTRSNSFSLYEQENLRLHYLKRIAELLEGWNATSDKFRQLKELSTWPGFLRRSLLGNLTSEEYELARHLVNYFEQTAFAYVYELAPSHPLINNIAEKAREAFREAYLGLWQEALPTLIGINSQVFLEERGDNELLKDAQTLEEKISILGMKKGDYVKKVLGWGRWPAINKLTNLESIRKKSDQSWTDAAEKEIERLLNRKKRTGRAKNQIT